MRLMNWMGGTWRTNFFVDNAIGLLTWPHLIMTCEQAS